MKFFKIWKNLKIPAGPRKQNNGKKKKKNLQVSNSWGDGGGEEEHIKYTTNLF